MPVAPLDLPPALLAISAIEDAFVAAIKATMIGPLLRQVESLPGDMSPQEVGDRMKSLPAAFVSFGGGEALRTRAAGLTARFTVFVVTGSGNAEEQRRRGTKITVGAYTLLQVIISSLHGIALPAPAVDGTAIDGLVIGSPQLGEASRYWTEDLDQLGLTIYGATFSLAVQFPPMPGPGDDDITLFREFFAQIALDGIPDGGESPPLPTADVASEDAILLEQD